ncbi:hypothetical protein [Halanaerobacter jeridensis]|uniref:Hydrogenase maturation protease n=1 Tax=Halanaerobacter jeridensis TaxID=706427 RepID=A0A938XTQ4_9FIRM|nr:hydrogenase maturation protease [Halanaerobacter jeridensis]
MSCELAVLGIGDVRKQDRGLAVYLLDALREAFTWMDVSFIYAGKNGRDLYEMLQDIKADKVLILDTSDEGIQPGEFNYLTLKVPEAEFMKEMLIVTIGIFSDDWGKKLSKLLDQEFAQIVDKVSSLILSLLN